MLNPVDFLLIKNWKRNFLTLTKSYIFHIPKVMVQLRKRKAPAEAAAAPPTKKPNSTKAAPAKANGAINGKQTAAANGTSSSGKPSPGDTVDLGDFGKEVETHDGEKTTLKRLVGKSEAGVVLFTYPKASTPGCKLITDTQSVLLLPFEELCD